MTPKEFEQIVSRIISIMVKSGSEVVYDDRIPDPDNPKQMRQIDIAINHDGVKSHIECRHRKKPQDVKWIEELMGKKDSLNAYSVIAVSSSGFTKGATLKAEAKGIFLHTLTQESPEMAETWGRKSKVEVGYYGFHPLDIRLIFDELPKASLQEVVDAFRSNNELINAIFNEMKYGINRNEGIRIFPYDLQVEGLGINMELLGKKIEKVGIRAKTYLIKEVLELPTMMTFSKSSHKPQGLAKVERSEAYNSEAIFAGSKVKVQIDLTKILNLDSNKIFAGQIELLFGEKTQVPEIVFIGSPDHNVSLYDVGLCAIDLAGNDCKRA